MKPWTVQTASKQRGQARFQARGEQQRFLQGFIDSSLRPHLEFGQAAQHFVAGFLGTLRVPVGAQAARRLG